MIERVCAFFKSQQHTYRKIQSNYFVTKMITKKTHSDLDDTNFLLFVMKIETSF